jgi:hypothetical protein
MKHIIISDNAAGSGEDEKIVYSNVTFVNLLLEEDVPEEAIHPDALTSYYLDYYDSQYRNGNFSQFVYNSGWVPEVNAAIERGLEQIRALQHLQLFRQQCAKVQELSQQQLEAFVDGEYFGENPERDLLKNDAFFGLEEKIGALNAAWLKAHPDLKVLSIDAMFDEAEQIAGRPIDRT